MKKQFFSRQFVLFLFTGGIAAVINFSSRIAYGLWFNFSLSIFLAYITGMISAFILAKVVVFKKGTQSTHRSIMWFTLVNLIAVLQTWIISISLANYLLPFLGVDLFVEEIAHAVGLAVPVFTSYLGHKRWSFREAY
ncbi:GtrA family protein [Legionella cincinnatiensis]|uniref:GtrA-like protein n=1 Tax=Legionella cincinnatiensis TaxID=28085 RepID=A0A378IMN1_9GAMM|nr:GtrA family protein [Legionella cincinnatiensis]KTC93490.1 GtrA-like protein [Legionella cincinnatiensis]STX36508.1 GtrA-like protein [Legionella cincinnatiensis]